MTSGALVRVERDASVAVVALDRPDRHNSLVPSLLEETRDGFRRLAADESVGAVVLRAEGRSFSTGGDLAGFRANRDDLHGYAYRLVGLLNETILTMLDHPVPIVAAVHGIVTGGSFGLVLASDVVLVGPEASFTPWYGRVGFAPDGGWTAMLPRVIGRQRASAVLLENRTITAAEAVDWGLAAGQADDVAAAAMDAARRIAGMKRGFLHHAVGRLRSERHDIAEALEQERRRFVEQVTTPEAVAGVDEFLDEESS